jgi:hypothetical protein
MRHKMRFLLAAVGIKRLVDACITLSKAQFKIYQMQRSVSLLYL